LGAVEPNVFDGILAGWRVSAQRTIFVVYFDVLSVRILFAGVQKTATASKSPGAGHHSLLKVLHKPQA
jgi:hypothetical protein